MTRLRVVICDDHRAMREALNSFLQTQPEIESVRLASSGDDAVRLVRAGADVLVLDLLLEGEADGLEVLEALANLALDVPVLVVSAADDLDLVARALTLGAQGFCRKDVRPGELMTAIRQVAGRETVLPEDLVGPVLRRLQHQRRSLEESRALLAQLTAREREVLRLLVGGLTRAEIATRLALSPNTVRTHLANAMEKLGVHSQLAAAARARELFEAVDRAQTARPEGATGRPPQPS